MVSPNRPDLSRARRFSSLGIGLLILAQPLPSLSQTAASDATASTAQVRVRSTALQTLASASSLPGLPLDSDLYVLGPGDALSLTFLDPSAGLGGALSILPDGTANLALLGSVQLTGLTIAQAGRWLTSLYARHLVRPELTLALTAPRPVRVSVLGEVEKPGLYPMAGAYSTAFMAIQQAGGITLNADVHNVLLRRRLPGPDGAQKQTVLDLGQVLQVGNQRQNPILFDGDTLVVSRSEKPLPSEIMQLAASNLSPGTISVQINGEVKAGGNLSLTPNTPLVEAILRAGGPTDWRADKGNVELIRLNRDGTTTREIFAINYTKGASNKFNPPLRNGDIVIVHRNLYGKTVDVLNQLVLPILTIPNTLYFYNNFNRR
ncbi:MAG: SLBB domain-containing protein [Synechococcaceae cyanobacterium]|nr:SLBB domain-containing protein [Synechococcaceae cyanobacterium]